MSGIDEISDDVQKLIDYNFDQVEPEFNSLQLDKPTFIIWRIEKLKLKKWPKDQNGVFYQGDSFLVLNIKSREQMYAHVWTGNQSSKDEISFVNFKVLQLDKKLENNLVIYYESQGKESELFKSYFDFFTVIKGGVDADLEQYKSENYRGKLFHVHSKGSKIQSREIGINRRNLDSGDVYLLDIGLKVFIWTGKKANSYEKFHMGCIAQKIKDIRHNKVTVVTLYEDDQDEKNKKEFDDYLDKYEESDFEKQQSFNSSFKKMMKLSDENGKLELTEVPYDRNNLKSEDSFLVDRGDAIIIWVGSKASISEKRFARFFANKYVNTESRNPSMPVYITSETKAGKELEKCFS